MLDMQCHEGLPALDHTALIGQTEVCMLLLQKVCMLLLSIDVNQQEQMAYLWCR